MNVESLEAKVKAWAKHRLYAGMIIGGVAALVIEAFFL